MCFSGCPAYIPRRHWMSRADPGQNRAIQDICRKLGFRTQHSISDPSVVTVVLDLG
jgi:hypothetical protein